MPTEETRFADFKSISLFSEHRCLPTEVFSWPICRLEFRPWGVSHPPTPPNRHAPECPMYNELRNKMLDDNKDLIFDFYYPRDESLLIIELAPSLNDQFHRLYSGEVIRIFGSGLVYYVKLYE